MTVTASFLAANNATLGTPLQIGPVTPADRGNKTVLLPRAASGAVPAGTRRILVTLTATRVNCCYDDAYADRIGLFLDAAQPPTTGPTGPGGNEPDTTPPETTITKAPKIKSSKSKAKFKFTSSEVNSTFQCKFDSKPFKPCDKGLKKYKHLDFGRHKFKVRATDASGNTDPTAARDKFKRR